MKNVLCFGDSNTWGAVPVNGVDPVARHGRDQRWTGVVQNRLGANWNVIAEGLPSRTTVIEDVIDGALFSGLSYLKPCLLSHAPLDYVVLFLGTNDCKRRFNLVAEDVAVGIDRLLKEIKFSDTLVGGMSHAVVICPPPIKVTGVFATLFEGGDVTSRTLAPYLQEIASAHGAQFLDAGAHIQSSDVDGIHFDGGEHHKLGTAVAKLLFRASGGLE